MIKLFMLGLAAIVMASCAPMERSYQLNEAQIARIQSLRSRPQQDIPLGDLIQKSGILFGKHSTVSREGTTLKAKGDAAFIQQMDDFYTNIDSYLDYLADENKETGDF